MRRLFLIGALSVLAVAAPAHAQIRVSDLVVTAGVAGEGYSGNLAAVTVPVIDSSRNAQAAIGEFGGHLELSQASMENRQFFDLTVDLGLRQFAATGFKVRDYAPREWVGSVDAAFNQALGGWGGLQVNGAFKGRAVEDRPPMPLFLQPGYNQIAGGVQLSYFARDRFTVDLGVRDAREDYSGSDPQLDLLDKRAYTIEGGLNWNMGSYASMRFFALLENADYPQQVSFDESDPTRRDRTVKLGLQWERELAPDLIDVHLGIEGTLNRSNSNRPEYDAAAFRAEVAFPIWWQTDVSVFTVITGKSYLFETDFARRVPGEEADNASLAQISFTRELAPNLDGVLRFGWTRAETDIGDQYYQRYGVSVLFNFRPSLR